MAHRAPALFGAASNYRTEWELREYVESEMVQLAEEGRLCVTDLMNQAPQLSELCGQIILGHEFREDGTMAQGQDVPPELAEYQVKLRALNGAKSVLVKRQAKMSGRVHRGRGSITTYSAETAEIPFGADGSLSLRLPEAWRVLRFCGKDCRKFRRATAQQRYWRCEEVRPEAAAPAESPRRRRAAAGE